MVVAFLGYTASLDTNQATASKRHENCTEVCTAAMRLPAAPGGTSPISKKTPSEQLGEQGQPFQMLADRTV